MDGWNQSEHIFKYSSECIEYAESSQTKSGIENLSYILPSHATKSALHLSVCERGCVFVCGISIRNNGPTTIEAVSSIYSKFVDPFLSILSISVWCIRVLFILPHTHTHTHMTYNFETFLSSTAYAERWRVVYLHTSSSIIYQHHSHKYQPTHIYRSIHMTISARTLAFINKASPR